jgi:glucose-1-phosphate thymidylyltransferase
MATDNLPRFDICDVLALYREKNECAVFACPEPYERLKRMGVAELDGNGRIVGFEEKPPEPRGSYRVVPFYALTAEAVDSVAEFLEEGNDPDSPGNFIAWLVERQPVYARVAPEGTWDIGTLESYQEVCREFESRG